MRPWVICQGDSKSTVWAAAGPKTSKPISKPASFRRPVAVGSTARIGPHQFGTGRVKRRRLATSPRHNGLWRSIFSIISAGRATPLDWAGSAQAQLVHQQSSLVGAIQRVREYRQELPEQ